MTTPKQELDSCLSMCEDILSVEEKSEDDLEFLSLLHLRLTGTSLGLTLGVLLKEEEIAQDLVKVLQMINKINSL